MTSGVDESNEDKPFWPVPATTATLAGIVSRMPCVFRMNDEKPPPSLPIASKTCESNELSNAKRV